MPTKLWNIITLNVMTFIFVLIHYYLDLGESEILGTYTMFFTEYLKVYNTSYDSSILIEFLYFYIIDYRVFRETPFSGFSPSM